MRLPVAKAVALLLAACALPAYADDSDSNSNPKTIKDLK